MSERAKSIFLGVGRGLRCDRDGGDLTVEIEIERSDEKAALSCLESRTVWSPRATTWKVREMREWGGRKEMVELITATSPYARPLESAVTVTWRLRARYYMEGGWVGGENEQRRTR